jgi:transposase
MNVRYRVELSQTERAQLAALLSGGKQAVRRLKRAQILLAADAGASDGEIARSVGVGGSTVYRTKRRFVLGNLEALNEEPRPGGRRKLSGKEEALLVATACAKPPAGRARWTLELLAQVRYAAAMENACDLNMKLVEMVRAKCRGGTGSHYPNRERQKACRSRPGLINPRSEAVCNAH